MNSIGIDTATLRTIDYTWDPDHGWSWRLVYVGTELTIAAQASLFQLQGYFNDVKHDGPIYTLTALLPEYQGPGEFIDRFNLDTEFCFESLWNQPTIKTLIGVPVGGSYSDNVFQDRKNMILTAIRMSQSDTTVFDMNNTPVKNGELLSEAQKQVFMLLTRGTEGVEVPRTILKRNRVIPLDSVSRMKLKVKTSIYTTAKLISTFEIPQDVQPLFRDIDTDYPVAPSDCAWTWKLRRDDTEMISRTAKAIEQRDWVYAAWSTVLYTLVS